MSRIFLSHSSKDNDSAVALRDWLSAQGWDDVFLDLDPQSGISPGEQWERALNQAALRCEAVLFLVSRAWLASDWCLKEFNLAHRLNKRLFGLLLDDVTIGDLPATLTGTWQLVPLASGRDHVMLRATMPGTQDEAHVTFSREGLTRLRIGLERAGLDPRFFAWPPENDPKRPPYRGLLPLEAADAGIFFGREAPTIATLDRIRGMKDGAAPRLLVLLGASGAGKSSFLRAGLLPRLSRDDRNYLVLPVIRPEHAAINGEVGLIRSLEAALTGHGIVMQRAEIRAAIEGGVASLRVLLQSLVGRVQTTLIADDPEAKAPALVLAIDQGEELFLADGATESAALLNLLRELLADDAPALLVVIAIRSDAYESLQTAKALEGITQQTASLTPMPRGAFQAVIEGPAARLKETDRPLFIEPALTEALLSDIEDGGGRDALPLLAFTLERLYLEYGGGGRLTLKDYNALGRIKGSIEAAVERAFRTADSDARIPRDRDARLVLLRRGLIPWLAGIDPDTGSPRRQKALVSEIPEEARPLIDLLVEQRLLSTDVSDETGERTIEPAHESLLRQWGTLQGWLQEDFAALTNLETVKRAARDWTANAKGEDWLSHRAGRLEDAERLLQRQDLAGNLGITERDYLAACSEREDSERREKTAVLERRLRQQRQFGIAAALVAIIMTIVGGLAYWQKTKADEATATAKSETVRAEKQTSLAEQRQSEAERQKARADEATASARSETARAERQTSLAEQRRLEAETQSKRATENESRGLAAFSVNAANEGSPTGSVALALAAWPRDQADPRPRLDVALRSLSLGFSSTVPILEEYHHDNSVVGARLIRDKSQILSWSSDKTMRLWDLASGQQIGPAMMHNGIVYGARLTRDETLILSWSGPLLFSSGPSTLQLWNATTGRQISPAMQHDNLIIGALFLRDETGILSWSIDKTLRLWNVATGQQIGPALMHEAAVNGALLFRNETRILSWSLDSTLRLWDVATGRQIGPAMKHDGTVAGALLLRDEKRILSWSDDNTLRLWDVATGRQIGTSLKHEDKVKGALLLHNETRILSWSDDKTLRLWDIATGRQIGPAMKHEGPVAGALLLHDETLILSWSDDATLRLWDAATGRQIGPAMKHEGAVAGALLFGDETRILSWSDDKTLRLWEVATGQQIGVSVKHEDAAKGALLLRDERAILSWSGGSTLQLWDLAIGRQIGPVMKHEGPVSGARLLRDETRILSWSADSTLRLWDAATGRQIGPVMKHEGAVAGALSLRDGKRILSWSDDDTLRMWDVATGHQIGPSLKHEDKVNGALLLSNETRILSWSSDSSLRLWDVTAGRQVGPAMMHEGIVAGALLLRNEARVLSWSDDKTLRMWDVATGRQIGPSLNHEDKVNGALLFRDDTRILSWSDDKTLRLWDVATGRQIGPSLKHENSVTGALLFRNETRILSWSDDHTLRLWDVATGLQIGPAMKHKDVVRGALLTPDENRILSWSGGFMTSIFGNSDSDTLLLWDVATGRQIGPAIKHDGPVNGAMLTHDGTRILSWAADNTLRVWDAATVEQIGPSLKHDDADVDGALLFRDETRVLSWSGDSLRMWDVSWHGRNLFEIACNYLPPDHDLSAVSARYGIKIADPICQPGKTIPVPDWSSVEEAPKN